MTQLYKLTKKYWPALYDLMRREAFPDVPDSLLDAKQAFKDMHAYGAWDEATGQLCLAIIFGDMSSTEHCAFIDVVCARHMRGRWATKRLLAQLYKLVFSKMGLAYVWAQPATQAGRHACLRAGFVVAERSAFEGAETPVLILTKHAAARFAPKLEGGEVRHSQHTFDPWILGLSTYQ